MSRAIPHPDFSGPSTVHNDFALLEMEHSVVFSASTHIRPVCMPTAVPEEGRKAVIAGWGKTEFNGDTATVLQKVVNA